MKNRYHVKKVFGGYALMDGDEQLYLTNSKKIASDDAAAFNRADKRNTCDECGKKDIKWNVCPNCGAKRA